MRDLAAEKCRCTLIGSAVRKVQEDSLYGVNQAAACVAKCTATGGSAACGSQLSAVVDYPAIALLRRNTSWQEAPKHDAESGGRMRSEGTTGER